MFVLTLMFPDAADAWPGKESSCTGCHSGTDPDATIYTAVDGVAGTSVTVAAGGSFEVDFYFENATEQPTYGIGLQVVVPDLWTISSGTSNSPTIGGPGWSTAWDAASGVGWIALYDTNTQFPGTDGSTINFAGASWDTGTGGRGSRNAACDEGPTCTQGGTDGDGVAERMGSDVTVHVDAGASGVYTMYVMAVGHDPGPGKTNVPQAITVTIGAGADTTPPAIGTVTPANLDTGVYVDGTFDLSATATEANTVTTCEYCVSTDGTCDTEWTAATVGGSAPNWTCTQAGITGYGDGASLTLNMRATDDAGTPNTGTGTPVARTVDSAATAIADLASSGNTSNSVDLTWSDPVDGGSGNASYDVRYVAGATFIEGQWAAANDPGGEPTPATTGMTVGSLSPTTQYTFAIKTTDNLGNQSAISNTVTVTTGAGDAPPTISISLPNGDSVTEGASFNITYTLADDVSATVDFYYDSNNTGVDGTMITECQNQIEGVSVTCAWDTTGELGTWYVYGRADDTVNGLVDSYSPGTLTVNATNNSPTLSISQPDGAGDTVVVGDAYLVTYTLSDDDVVTAAFYYDVDNDMAGGTPITGACATAAEGAGATCSWDTTGVTPGSYYVYGETDDGVNPLENAVTLGVITIEADANPNTPTGYDQYYDEVADVLINSGWSIRDTSVKIQATVSDTNATQQVELEVDIGVTTDNVADCTSGLAANGATVEATCSGLVNGNTYVWQVRTSDENGNKSGWVSSGSNLTVKTAMDLGVAGGPNASPTLTINQPSGQTIAEGTATYNINYDLADADSAATVTFYYETDGDMAGGTPAIDCGGVGEGTGATCAWNTSAVAPGTYYVYGDATDGINPTVKALSGTLTINAAPTLSIAQPDGVGDSVVQGNSFNVTYTMNDADDAGTTVSFYYETDGDMAGGVAVTGCTGVAQGAGVTCAWDTSSATPATYYIYGVADDGVNAPVSVLSGTIDVTANAAPTLSISQPAGGNVTVGTAYNITYTLNDVDDVTTVAFYYETDGDMAGGTLAANCAAAPEGTDVTCAWNTTGVTHSTSYYIYGVANDGINGDVKALSPGLITVDQANNAPVLNITQPDGVGDSVVAGDPYDITYTLTDAEDIATVTFYYDLDNTGQDGTDATGCATQAESPTSTTCSWDTNGVPAGTYYVYGVATDGVNPDVVVYSSGTIEIGGELVTNPEFNTTTNWTISLDIGTGSATCVYDPATDHTGDASGSVKGHEEGQDNAFTCTITQDISSIVTKDATISTASIWTLFSSNFEAAGDSVTIDLALPATSPADTDTNVVLDSDVTINFSEDVECATVTNTNITMTPPPATSWTVFSCSGGQAVMRPLGQVNNTSYTVDVTLNVTDLAGNTGTPFSFSYTTEP